MVIDVPPSCSVMVAVVSSDFFSDFPGGDDVGDDHDVRTWFERGRAPSETRCSGAPARTRTLLRYVKETLQQWAAYQKLS
jgi:hypothetical protein